MEEVTLARRLRRIRRGLTAPTTGPLVSIVVANRDGVDHLRRLLDGLGARTRYDRYELIVVDNASTDESLDVLAAWDGPVSVIRNDQNTSFSAANNQGIRAARGDLVLLANNDLDPVDSNWLGFMVDSLTEGVVAVGAMLVYPTRPRRASPPDHPDHTVQHLGTTFERSKWGVRAFNRQRGSDPLRIVEPGRVAVPAVTAACLLARRQDLIETPFDETYWYGTEDWDLCLRLGQRGSVVVDERAVLFHHEYGTQDKFMSEAWLDARTRNHHWFNDLWGPAVLRRLRTEISLPESDRFYRGEGQLSALLIGSRRRQSAMFAALERQADRRGWAVSDNERSGADLVIALDVPTRIHRFANHDLSIAVVLDEPERWSASGALDAATRVVVPDRLMAARVAATWGHGVAVIEPSVADASSLSLDRLIELAVPRPDSMRIGVATSAPDWERAQMWGDTYFARGLMRAFGRLGHETTELIRPDWRSSSAAACDVVVTLRGLHRRSAARGQWNVLWIISHPDRLDNDEYDEFDVIAVASPLHAERLERELRRPVHFLPQATDTDVFKLGERNVDFESPVLYAGIARWPNRRAPRWMARSGRDFDLYGRNWEDFPEGDRLRGEHIANRDLAAAYRSASIVVADHHGSMRRDGFVANRIFDVLASGGTVLSDDVAGLEHLFGDLVPVYRSASELETQIRTLLADPELRRSRSRSAREIVLADHTFDRRADQILTLLDEL